MPKICFIQQKIKDNNFLSDNEKINFQLLKALSESMYDIDIICAENDLQREYKFNDIMELSAYNFNEVAYSLAKEKDYNLIFSPDYVLSDALYLSKHSISFKEQIGRSKLEALCSIFLLYKTYNEYKKENYLQQLCTQKSKVIFTPSSILKNDLIHMYKIDGQKVYILPPYVDMPKRIKQKKNQKFTFGFISNRFLDDGGLILLKAMKKLRDYKFKLKIFYRNNTPPEILKYYIKLFRLEEKIEFVINTENLDVFYNQIDCLLMPAKHEPFGLSALEAMSSGKIVLISSMCGAKDLIEHESNGFIFDITSNPIRNLKRAMEYILINKDDFENMQQKAIFTASEYNYDKFRNEFMRILEKYFETNQEN